MSYPTEHILSELLPDFLEGKLSVEDQTVLDAWLAEDEAHVRLFNEFIAVWHQSKETTSPISSATSWQHFLKKANKQPNVGLQVHRNRWMGIAASICLMLGLAWWLNSKSPSALTMVNAYTVQDSLRLDDGSTIYSNGSAVIDYPKAFAKNQREINQISGTAFFEITKNPSRPFIIHNPIADIRVLGTSYKTVMTKDYVEVIVTTGKVKVYNQSDSIILLPTEKVVFYADQREPIKSTNTDINYLSFKTNILEFQNQTLDQLFKEVATLHPYQFKLDATIGANRVNGKFYADNLQQLLLTISETFDLTYQIHDSTITLSAK